MQGVKLQLLVVFIWGSGFGGVSGECWWRVLQVSWLGEVLSLLYPDKVSGFLVTGLL